MSVYFKVFDEGFALCEQDHVVGVVTKCNDTQWKFVPLVKGEYSGVCDYVPLDHALKVAMSFKAKP